MRSMIPGSTRAAARRTRRRTVARGARRVGVLAGLAGLAVSAAVVAAAAPAALRVTSPAFKEGAAIPTRHTCDGADVSPALGWTGVPKGAKSLAVICDDPDAPGGTWVHWVLFGLPAATAGLPEGVGKLAALPDGWHQGVTDFGRPGYGGPCPPPGKPHRYLFKVYALDAVPNLKGKVTKARLEGAMHGHVLAEGRLTGTYRR